MWLLKYAVRQALQELLSEYMVNQGTPGNKLEQSLDTKNQNQSDIVGPRKTCQIILKFTCYWISDWGTIKIMSAEFRCGKGWTHCTDAGFRGPMIWHGHPLSANVTFPQQQMWILIFTQLLNCSNILIIPTCRTYTNTVLLVSWLVVFPFLTHLSIIRTGC